LLSKNGIDEFEIWNQWAIAGAGDPMLRNPRTKRLNLPQGMDRFVALRLKIHLPKIRYPR
jgi:hypothetical protein